jgi:hypothetical protein
MLLQIIIYFLILLKRQLVKIVYYSTDTVQYTCAFPPNLELVRVRVENLPCDPGSVHFGKLAKCLVV